MDIVVRQIDPDLGIARRHYCSARHAVIGWMAVGLHPDADVFCPLCGGLAPSSSPRTLTERSVRVNEYQGRRCEHGFPDLPCGELVKVYPEYDWQFAAQIPAYRPSVPGKNNDLKHVIEWARPCGLCRDRMAAEYAAVLRHELDAVAHMLNEQSREAGKRLRSVDRDITALRPRLRRNS